MNQWVIGESPWTADLHISSFEDDLRGSHQLFDGNELTLGLFLADYASQDLWYLGGNRLMTLQNNAQPININLDNNVVYSKDGVYSATGYEVNASYSGQNEAVVIGDEWKFTPKFKADVGVRYEHETMNMTFENSNYGVDYSSPLNLYDDNGAALNGTYTTLTYDKSKMAYTAGADYDINEHFNSFVRYNSGFRLPSFDDMRGSAPNEPQTESIQQGEIGLRMKSHLLTGDATVFYNTFAGVCSQVILTTGPQEECTNSRAYGVELDADLRPFSGFDVGFTGTYDNSISTGSISPGAPGCTFGSFACVEGNQSQDVPQWTSRVTPAYSIPTEWGKAKLWLTWTYVGQRYGDPQNLQVLPEYNTLDIGAMATFGDIDIMLTGTNITNTLAITEGSYRLEGTNGLTPYPGSTTTMIDQGRPLFGASYQLAVSVHF